ncbi:MAG TPA: glutamate--tRNA ligase [Thermoanaerobaculia bacterium]|nr:glutamate--tRNA ligase [Thermoanaerobaculia bacterium]
MTPIRPVRVRFAPSPTGHLHVGGARTAIFNWLFARRHRGAFIIRVEDTDQVRSTLESEAMVLDDLRWLGLEWDEGPEVGGPFGPYRQSERMDRYAEVARDLVARGRAYPCYCDEETLERKRLEAEAAGRPPHYDLTCWNLPLETRNARAAAATPHVIRFHVPKEDDASFSGDVTINDLIRGEVTWKKESLGDFILLRSDGMPTYNFCVVVDDHQMEITHVIRAEEHLTNTHRQVLIYRAMEWATPAFAHVSLILGQDRSKLSKRHGATSVSQFAEEGFVADAMINYLALLGWSPPDGEEIFSREKAIANFSLDRVNSAPAVFDPDKLLWVNATYLRQMESGLLRRTVSRELEMEGIVTTGGEAAERWLDDAIDLLKSGIERMPDIVRALRIFFVFDPERAAADDESRAALDAPEARGVVAALEEELARAGAIADANAFQAVANAVKAATGQKGKALFMPIRLAITGSIHGPELARTVPLLDRGSRTPGIGRVLSPLERVAAFRRALG